MEDDINTFTLAKVSIITNFCVFPIPSETSEPGKL